MNKQSKTTHTGQKTDLITMNKQTRKNPKWQGKTEFVIEQTNKRRNIDDKKKKKKNYKLKEQLTYTYNSFWSHFHRHKQPKIKKYK